MSLLKICTSLPTDQPELQDDCVQTVRAGFYQSNIELKCSVRADPPPQNIRVTWQEEGETKSIGVGEKHNHLKLVLKQGVSTLYYSQLLLYYLKLK